MKMNKQFERTNIPGFVKDTKHGVVINTNTDEYQRILDKRKHKKELDTVKSEMTSLQNELKEMKSLKDELNEMKELLKNIRRN